MSNDAVFAPVGLRGQLTAMLDELERCELHVVLVPAPEPQYAGHSVRMVVAHNPRWYRELCALFPRGRRFHRNRNRYPDSRVKREHAANAIRRLLSEQGSRSGLAPFLLAFAREERDAEQARRERETEQELDVVFGPAAGCGVANSQL
jgi:hypothetical protein